MHFALCNIGISGTKLNFPLIRSRTFDTTIAALMEYYDRSLELHSRLKGKIETCIKVDISNKEDLSLLYSPGVAQPCIEISQNPEDVYKYTIKGNTIAIV